ncbi:MAG: hypothetical protein QM775_36180 [Pirellulales bacterium]
MKTYTPIADISDGHLAVSSLQPRRRVLVAIHSNTFFIELFRAAKLVQACPDFELEVLFAWPYPTQARDVSACRGEGIVCLGEDGCEIPEPTTTDTAQPSKGSATTVARPRLSIPYRAWLKILTLKNRSLRGLHDALPPGVRAWLRRCKIFWAKSQPEFLDWHVRRGEFAEKVLRDRQIDLLVLGGDMPGYDTSDFIAAAHRLNIPVALVPSTMSNGIEQAEAYFHNPQFHVKSMENRTAVRKYLRLGSRTSRPQAAATSRRRHPGDGTARNCTALPLGIQQRLCRRGLRGKPRDDRLLSRVWSAARANH